MLGFSAAGPSGAWGFRGSRFGLRGRRGLRRDTWGCGGGGGGRGHMICSIVAFIWHVKTVHRLSLGQDDVGSCRVLTFQCLKLAI